MKKVKVLVVVDMQNDFVNGALGTKEAQAIVKNVVEKIEGFEGKIFATLDTHEDDYLETQEGKHLPVYHCIKFTDGWLLNDGVRNALKNKDVKYIEKHTFGSNWLTSLITELTYSKDIEVELIGLCTDICVISNALLLKSCLPDVEITVDASCCAGVTPETHKAALETMKMCQIKVIGE